MSFRPFAEVRREQPPERFVPVDGHLVYVEQQGAGEAVVLLHGFGASSYSWRKVIPELARSFRVVAIDLNGFGWTERPSDPRSYSRDGQIQLVLGVMRELGIRRAHFVGHSYGGSLTLYMAARHPEVVRSMVLVDSAAPTYSDDRRSRLASIRPLDSLLVRLALTPSHVRRSLVESVYDPAVITPEVLQAYLDRLRVHGVVDAYYGLTARFSPPAAAATAPAADTAPAPGTAALPRDGGTTSANAATPPPAARTPSRAGFELEQLIQPALVIWGADDQVIPVEAGRRATRRLPAGEFVTIPRCGHLPMEERPAELLALMVPFLERHRETAGAGLAPVPPASALRPSAPRGGA